MILRSHSYIYYKKFVHHQTKPPQNIGTGTILQMAGKKYAEKSLNTGISKRKNLNILF